MKNIAIGVDIGGSHISSVLVDMDCCKILTDSYVTQEINNKAEAHEILENWTSVIQKSIRFAHGNNIIGIGFSMPGPFDYEKGIALFEKVEKYENIYGINISEKLQNSLLLDTELPFRFMNDATSFAVGEAWQGKAMGYKKSLSIALGTGLGSAFIDNGLPVVERVDIPEMGCLWHIPYKDGIADDYFSTRWFVKKYAAKTGRIASGVKEIAQWAMSENIAKSLFVEFGTNLAEFLGPWISRFDPEILVIGGNMTKAYKLFGPTLELGIRKQNINVKIDLSEILEDSALLGSARLLDDSFWKNIQPLLSKM